MSLLKEGDKAPEFSAVDQDGNNLSLSSLKGNKVILYFYPKDNTPGCTKEACNFRDHFEELTNHGFEVIGVSPDSDESHIKFKDKYKLPFRLIPDPEKEILKLYGAWGEKKMYGKLSKGVLRTTYVIDEEGIIVKVINKVDTKNHTEQIFKELSK